MGGCVGEEAIDPAQAPGGFELGPAFPPPVEGVTTDPPGATSEAAGRLTGLPVFGANK